MSAEVYQVVIVKYGTRRTVRSDVYLNYGIYGAPNTPIDMDYFVWVIRNERRTVVVDTGFSRAGGLARDRTSLIQPARVFERLGVDPANAPTVVLTHAHYDHAGNLGLFPHSEIIISAAEHAFWTSRLAGRAQFRHSIEDADIAEIEKARAQGRVTTFADE